MERLYYLIHAYYLLLCFSAFGIFLFIFIFRSEPMKSTSTPKIAVVFHVLISNDMLDDPRDKVLIKFGCKELGTWNSNEHEMACISRYI